MNVLLWSLLVLSAVHSGRAAFSTDTLCRKLESQLRRITSETRLTTYHHTATQISKTFKTIRFSFSQAILYDLERVQLAVSRLRSEYPGFSAHEEKWTTWSVAHSQAVLYDRANRLLNLLSRGRAHPVSMRNFEKSILLLGIALSSTIGDVNGYRRDVILTQVSPPIVSAVKKGDVEGRLRGVVAIIEHYGSNDSLGIMVDLLCYAVVLMIAYMFVKRIVTV